jgi:hypothetical protein
VDVPGYGDARGDRWCGAEALDVAGDGRGGVEDGVLSCPDVDPSRNQIHHTQCGAGALADDIFRRTCAERIGAEWRPSWPSALGCFPAVRAQVILLVAFGSR